MLQSITFVQSVLPMIKELVFQERADAILVNSGAGSVSSITLVARKRTITGRLILQGTYRSGTVAVEAKTVVSQKLVEAQPRHVDNPRHAREPPRVFH
jgi:hypothetical protein